MTNPIPNGERLIDEKQAAEVLSVSIRTMQNWRHRGGGPLYIKLNTRAVRYRLRDLMAYAEERLVSSTSEAGTRL